MKDAYIQADRWLLDVTGRRSSPDGSGAENVYLPPISEETIPVRRPSPSGGFDGFGTFLKFAAAAAGAALLAKTVYDEVNAPKYGALASESTPEIPAHNRSWGEYLARRKAELGSQAVSVSLLNSTNIPLYASLLYQVPNDTGRWMGRGWFAVMPGQTSQTDIITTTRVLYAYAKSAVNALAPWSGEGSSDSIYSLINPTSLFDYEHISGVAPSAGQECVNMYCHKPTNFGLYMINFSRSD